MPTARRRWPASPTTSTGWPTATRCGPPRTKRCFNKKPENRRRTQMSKKQIEACVRETLDQYFKDLHGVEPHSMHEMFMNTVEKPLLDVVLRHADGNQSKAAEWLGINRNTLRRKLLEHKLVDQ